MAARAAGWGQDKIDAELRRMMEVAPEVPPDGYGDLSGPPSGTSDGRPAIHLAAGESANNCREAIAALGADTAARPLDGVYVRDRMLVRPVRVADLGKAAETKGGVKRSPEALVLVPVELAWLMTRLADVALFSKYDARMRQVVVADPPQRLAAATLAASPWPGIPVLRGVVQAPTLRPDGSVFQAPGCYDLSSGLLFDPGHEAFLPVPAEPTPDQAAAAKALIDRTFSTFPFVGEAARSVAIAACLTALVRRSLKTAPGFVFDAPKMGNGKGLLAHIPAWIATGTGPHLRPASENNSDESKSMFATLLESPLVVLVDNLEHTLKSEMLCAMLTTTVLSDRILGQSKTVSVPTNVTLLFTGNNLVIAGDLRRRILVSRIDAKVEHPEQRRFPGPPLERWAIENRADLAVALLTLARAYLAAGEPRPDVVAFGSFEQWSRLVRFPLIFSGFEDPCQTLAALKKGDPVTRDLRALLQAWHDDVGERPVPAKEIAERASGCSSLHEALTPFVGKDGKISTLRLGNYLSKHRERIEDGLCIEEAGERQSVALWRVTKVGER